MYSLNQAAAGASEELEWQRRFLLCRTFAESGRNQDASRESVGLIAAAESVSNPELVSESVMFRANLLAKAGQSDEQLHPRRMLFLTNALRMLNCAGRRPQTQSAS